MTTPRYLDAPPCISYENPMTAYTRPSGVDLVQFINASRRSDTFEQCLVRTSADNGRTWTAPEVLAEASEEGDVFTHAGLATAFLDPATGILIGTIVRTQQEHRSVYSGFRASRTLLRFSHDGGETWTPFKPIVQDGPAYDERHWALGITMGQNDGGNTTPAMARHGETILLPLASAAVDERGALYDPLDAYGFLECLVLIGRWNEEKTDLIWDCRQRLRIDPAKSSRGLMEPTIAPLHDGRILMVMRGSNVKIPDVAGIKWFSLSDDGGWTWREPAPLPYDDGSTMFSSSTYSSLIRHSNGTLYWVGNVSSTNPHGNWPRHPLVVAEVDEDRIAVRRGSLQIVSDRVAGDFPRVQLSNFWVYEDRETGELVVLLGKFPEVSEEDWTSHLYEYRVAPGRVAAR